MPGRERERQTDRQRQSERERKEDGADKNKRVKENRGKRDGERGTGRKRKYRNIHITYIKAHQQTV